MIPFRFLSSKVLPWLACFFVFDAVAKEAITGPHIRIDWLAPESFSKNGETFVGIRFRPEPGWHVYWKNPGDSGAAPKFEITSSGADITGPYWPFPTRLPVAHLTNLGYEGETAYLFKVHSSESPSVQVVADLEWLVCKEECIPGFGQLTLERPILDHQARIHPDVKSQLEVYRSRLPLSEKVSPFQIALSRTEEGYLKALVTSSPPFPESLDLFPLHAGYVAPQQPVLNRSESEAEFLFQTSPSAPVPSDVGILLVADDRSYEFPSLKLNSNRANRSDGQEWGSALWIMIFFAFIGGVLLNLMPCVFPVISMKAFSLLKTESRSERRRDGLHYTLGVLVTFSSLGAGFLLLRHFGEAVGWGFQLQSPIVVFSLALLFWMIALNFLGVFEIGSSIMNLTGRFRWTSSFSTGVLSVFVAAPCTGPFMGAALGATATLPAVQSLLIFFVLGLGLAFPYLALTLSPGTSRWLPKPGEWMRTLKEFFAFPLFATVLWLLWVLGHQAGTQGWTLASATLLMISFSFWLGNSARTAIKSLAWILALISVAFAVSQIRSYESMAKTSADPHSNWTPYSDEKMTSALEKGQAVFVDFTAAWCITCQVNKTAVLETKAADEIFRHAGVLRMRADWTQYDPNITGALERLGRTSVPVYAYYSKKGAAPILLPQILTLDIIKNTVSNREESP